MSRLKLLLACAVAVCAVGASLANAVGAAATQVELRIEERTARTGEKADSINIIEVEAMFCKQRNYGFTVGANPASPLTLFSNTPESTELYTFCITGQSQKMGTYSGAAHEVIVTTKGKVTEKYSPKVAIENPETHCKYEYSSLKGSEASTTEGLGNVRLKGTAKRSSSSPGVCAEKVKVKDDFGLGSQEAEGFYYTALVS